MHACASLGCSVKPGASDDIEPLVFVNGAPDRRLHVVSYHVDGPMDTRRAALLVDEASPSAETMARWLDADVVVALPAQLSDGETRWPVLSHGSLSQVESGEVAGQHELTFELLGDWERLLELPPSAIWWLNDSGTVTTRDDGELDVGLKANRSLERHSVNGSAIYLIGDGTGEAWTVADALETISATAGLSLNLQGLTRDVIRAELMQSIDLTKPLSNALERILEPYQLCIVREMNRSGGLVVEQRFVRPISHGRPIRLGWGGEAASPSDLLSVDTDQPSRAARKWIARASGWMIESTFDLVGAWDPSLEGLSNDEYDRDLSSNFALYEDVYRRWVLNEDGYYSQPLYNRGPAFNLNGFFGVTGIATQTLPFGDNLTGTSIGNGYPPVVELSTNGGVDWTIATISIDELKDRAGVYLDPDTLPGDFLSAAKTGFARVRVTATLTNPLPVQLTRWQGNAFSPQLPDRVVDVSDHFFFRRVDPDSIHYAGVSSGNLVADEIDDTQRMFRWLVDTVTRDDQGGERLGGQAKLKLSGLWPMLRPGDKLLNVGGPSVAADGGSQALTGRGGTVRSVKLDYSANSRNGRTTTVDVTY